MSATGDAPVATTAPRRQEQPRKRALSERARAERRLGLLLCAPAVIVMLAVTAFPIINAFILSLQRSDLRFPDRSAWVGFDNYVAVLGNSLWWKDLVNTAFITVVTVSIELVLGMAIALVMFRAIFARGLVRAIVLIPYGIITVVSAFAWRYAWTPDLGFLVGHNTAPLTDHWSSLFIICLAEIWKTTPFMSLLLLAGLALVPSELHEAAKVDGAGAVQRFFRITVPLMKPAILVAVLFRTLDAFRVFDNVFILTSGANNTESVSILGYNQLFVGLNLGVGSAVSVLIFVIIAAIGIVFVKGFGTAAPGQAGAR